VGKRIVVSPRIKTVHARRIAVSRLFTQITSSIGDLLLARREVSRTLQTEVNRDFGARCARLHRACHLSAQVRFTLERFRARKSLLAQPGRCGCGR